MASKKFSDLAPKQQGLILALLPVVLAFVVFYNFVSPLSKQASQLKAEVAALHQQNMRGRMLEAQHTLLQKKIAQAQNDLAALREIVPDEPADDRFVTMLYNTAQASSVHIRVLQASPAVRQTYFTGMPFQVHLDGTYYGMLDFFARLAGSQRIVNVAGLSLSSPASSSGGKGAYKPGPQETLAANCLLTTFYNNPSPAPLPGKPRR
ncbi:MAG: type 4a pilus biogenesis protein PilO [Terriglobia bacterium]